MICSKCEQDKSAWCGEKVMYDDHVTLPEGYERKRP